MPCASSCENVTKLLRHGLHTLILSFTGVANLYERVERMGKLEPMFVDITWGAGGSTTDLTLELR